MFAYDMKIIYMRIAIQSLIICSFFAAFLPGAGAQDRDAGDAKDRAVDALMDRFEGESGPALLRSYDTDDIYIKEAAYTYDNALAAMAFLSEGRADAAARILDGFSYAAEHDRYQPDRIRNAYVCGPVGLEHGISLPGWWDAETNSWLEDRYQTGSNTGNTAYAALALLQYMPRWRCCSMTGCTGMSVTGKRRGS